jgi:hypothetical protein
MHSQPLATIRPITLLELEGSLITLDGEEGNRIRVVVAVAEDDRG